MIVGKSLNTFFVADIWQGNINTFKFVKTFCNSGSFLERSQPMCQPFYNLVSTLNSVSTYDRAEIITF